MYPQNVQAANPIIGAIDIIPVHEFQQSHHEMQSLALSDIGRRS